MPESSPPQRINTGLYNDAVKGSVHNGSSAASSPRYLPPDSSSLHYTQKSDSSPSFMNDDPLPGSASGRYDVAQTWNHVNGGDEVMSAPADTSYKAGRTEESPDSKAVNGLSFISRPILENNDSSQGMNTEHDYGTERSHQNVGLHEDKGLLPAFAVLDRSNSFPAVPPLHQTRNFDSQPHPQSQVESILEEDEEAADMAQRIYDASDDQPIVEQERSEADFFGNPSDNEDNGLLRHGVAEEAVNVSFSPADEEARFEEGLPLMQSESATDEQARNSPDLPSGVSNEATGQVPDFFSEDAESPDEASFFKPAALDRKSTSQVLGSLSYPPHNATHDDNAFTSSTVDPQMVAEQSQPTETSPPPASKKDEDLAAMWQAALDDDDLLDDGELSNPEVASSAEAAHAIPHQTSQLPGLQQDRYSPASSQGHTPSFAYQNPMSTIGHQFPVSSMSSLSHSSSAPAGFGQAALQHGTSRPSMPKPAQSFADKSKGGYTSPYDLPMDVTRPKRRTNLQQMQNASNSGPSPPPPPPRSTSMYATGVPTDDLSPPLPPLPRINPSLPSERPSSSDVRAKPSVRGFFEELPSTKSRPTSSAGRYAPPAPQQQYGELPPRPEPPRQPPSTQRPGLTSSNTSPTYRLVPPERHSPYANSSQHDTPSIAPLQANPRYSPAPPLPSNVPPPRNKYAASPVAPGSRPPAPTSVMPFQPRTSSPLANGPLLTQQHSRKSSLPSDVPERPQPPPRFLTAQQPVIHGHPPALPQ
ncbi:MAG: hypothetical protein Q9218_000864, partial [Villophora microphyllina]